MPGWVRSVAARSTARAPTLLTLDALGTLAVWGRYNDWRLSPARAAEQGTVKQEGPEPAVKVLIASTGSGMASTGLPASEPVRVEFPSAQAVDKVGIRVAPAQTRALTHTVRAPGKVDYDPGRYVRLTARASGAPLRVEKEIGDPVRKGELLALTDAAEVGKVKADLLQDLTQVRSRETAPGVHPGGVREWSRSRALAAGDANGPARGSHPTLQ